MSTFVTLPPLPIFPPCIHYRTGVYKSHAYTFANVPLGYWSIGLTNTFMIYLDELRKRCGRQWPAIAKAKQEAAQHAARFRQLLQQHDGGPIDSSDVNVVAFGSLAREEWTAGSDLDWTLLIDGQADPHHAVAANHLASRLDQNDYKEPGRTAVFGTLAFSHNLIHQIGGQDDSNRNTTQRLLLLLESRAIGRDEAHDRVLRGILNRYLMNDPREYQPHPVSLRVPRFLCNDVVRYWRTMCVDYANKYRDRAGEGWAIRHLKLRLSRKLIFASGLLTCFHADPEFVKANGYNLAAVSEDVCSHLRKAIDRSPLEALAESSMKFGSVESARNLFDAYNDFLAVLDDPVKRKYLEILDPTKAENDSQFQFIREIGRTFHNGMVALFFRDHERLRELSLHYGVF